MVGISSTVNHSTQLRAFGSQLWSEFSFGLISVVAERGGWAWGWGWMLGARKCLCSIFQNSFVSLLRSLAGSLARRWWLTMQIMNAKYCWSVSEAKSSSSTAGESGGGAANRVETQSWGKFALELCTFPSSFRFMRFCVYEFFERALRLNYYR